MSLSPKARTEDIVVQKTDNETLVYDLKTNKAICLNETAAIVWENCCGEKDVSQISIEASKKLDSTVSEEVIALALDQLKKEKLLTNVDKLDARFAGLNRREIIKRVGLTSMVALPIVSAIVAPQASHAQSGCTLPLCIAAMDNICQGCAGTMITLLCFNSTDGSCSMGTSSSPTPFSCSSSPTTTTVDCQRS